MTDAQQAEVDLAEEIGSFTHDPLAFCKYAYPWGEGELATAPGPREWQAVTPNDIGEHLRNPETRHQPCQIADASGHGIGKSALIAMIIGWAMSTCEDCRVIVTANTEPQLRTKTWPEVRKWAGLAINKHWFSVTDTKISSVDPGHEGLWRCDRVTWSENNTEAFAGLHNIRKRIVLIFDEASAIADKVWEVAEGAMTDEDTEIIWIVFGNPTLNSGRFKECFGKNKHRWNHHQIDSRTVEGTNKAQIDKWIEDYGVDSDFVRVRVRGEFPRSGSTQFIASDVVAACRKYKAEGYETLPKILVMDVARFGADQTVIGLRQGRKFDILAKYRGLDTAQSAQRLIPLIEEHSPEVTVIDGDGIGGGVIDHLKFQGYTKGIFEFHGGAAAIDPQMYLNKRAEVWGMSRDWLKAGAQIPDLPEMESDLTGPQYDYSKSKHASGALFLESKDDMKARGMASPDLGDCLAMSFAVKVAAKRVVKKEQYAYPGQQAQGWMG